MACLKNVSLKRAVEGEPERQTVATTAEKRRAAYSLSRPFSITASGGPMPLVDWHSLVVNLLHFGASDLAISVVEKILRPIAVYLLLVFALRRFGKRILRSSTRSTWSSC